MSRGCAAVDLRLPVGVGGLSAVASEKRLDLAADRFELRELAAENHDCLLEVREPLSHAVAFQTRECVPGYFHSVWPGLADRIVGAHQEIVPLLTDRVNRRQAA